MKKGKIFYGWIIVLAGLIVTAAGIGIFNSTFSVFVKPVCDDLGLARGEFTFYRTIITLVGAFLMPLYARMIRRIGVKKVILVCAVGLGFASMAYSFATSLWHFYIIAAVNGIFFNGVNFMTVGTLVSEWFDDKKGFATGLAYCGSGLGGAIMVPIVGQIIERTDWRWAYRSLAVLGIVILVPVVLLLIRERPADLGLAPYTEQKKAAGARRSTAQTVSGLTMGEALRTPAFWMLAVAFFLVSILAGGPHTHTVPYLTDIGYTGAYAAAIVSFTMILLTVGKIALGAIFDRFGTLVGSIFVSVCCLGFPLFAMAAARHPAMPWMYGMLYGMASTGISVPVSVLISRYFGTRDFAAIFSVCTMITTFGTSAAVPAMGVLYDVMGHYQWAWVMLFVMAIVITIGLVGAHVLRPTRSEERAEALREKAAEA